MSKPINAHTNVAAAIHVDRLACQLSGGGPVTEDHREINGREGPKVGT